MLIGVINIAVHSIAWGLAWNSNFINISKIALSLCISQRSDSETYGNLVKTENMFYGTFMLRLAYVFTRFDGSRFYWATGGGDTLKNRLNTSISSGELADSTFNFVIFI